MYHFAALSATSVSLAPYTSPKALKSIFSHPSQRFDRRGSALTERGGVSHRRQQDSEQAPAPFIACELDSPAVRLDRPASDRKTQSDAAFFPGAAGIHPIEAIEDTIPVCSRNPRAGVSYLDHCLPDARFQFDADGSANRRVFYRVVDHVRQGMAHE